MAHLFARAVLESLTLSFSGLRWHEPCTPLLSNSSPTTTREKGHAMLDNSGTVDIPGDQNAPTPLAGTPVYDANGGKLGTVTRYDGQQAYFVMEKGALFHKDVYVPLDAIAGAHADGIRLYITRDDLRNVKWDQPPASGSATTSPTDADMLQQQRELPNEPLDLP